MATKVAPNTARPVATRKPTDQRARNQVTTSAVTVDVTAGTAATRPRSVGPRPNTWSRWMGMRVRNTPNITKKVSDPRATHTALTGIASSVTASRSWRPTETRRPTHGSSSDRATTAPTNRAMA